MRPLDSDGEGNVSETQEASPDGESGRGGIHLKGLRSRPQHCDRGIMRRMQLASVNEGGTTTSARPFDRRFFCEESVYE